MTLRTLLHNGSPLSPLLSLTSALFLSPRGWWYPSLHSFAPLHAGKLPLRQQLSLFVSSTCHLFAPSKKVKPFGIRRNAASFAKHPGGVVALSWLAARWAHAVVAPGSCWRVGGPQFLSPAPLLKSRKAAFVADPMKKTVYLSLGSNLGDRAKNLRDAIAALGNSGVSVVRVSSVYETEPVDYLDQPWFLNCALEAETELAALDLLQAVRGIEAQMGSKKLIAKGPRLIDIDILLYGNEIVDTPELQVPHPRMHLRRFVLEPLAEVAPSVQHPVSHLSISELLARTPDKSAVRVAAGP